MRTEQKREKQVSNQTDSSISVDERQIKESRGGWQRSLPLPDLSRKIEGPLLAGYSEIGFKSGVYHDLIGANKNYIFEIKYRH